MSIENKEQLVERITSWIQEKMRQSGSHKLEIDISGGVDSAVAAALCVRAAGSENVIGVYSGCQSSPQSRSRAREVASAFHIKMAEIVLDDVFDLIVDQFQREFDRLDLQFATGDKLKDQVVFGSLRSTLRAPVGRFANRVFGGGLRVGTGNRDEDELVRFYQKGGDGEVDMNPIAGLFKSEVWDLAEYLGVPKSVIDAKPSPDLWGTGDDHNDEDEMLQLTGVPLTYTRPNGELGTIEWVSRENEKNGVITGKASSLNDEELESAFGYRKEQIQIIKMVRNIEAATRHKSEPPPFPQRSLLVAENLVR